MASHVGSTKGGPASKELDEARVFRDAAGDAEGDFLGAPGEAHLVESYICSDG